MYRLRFVWLFILYMELLLDFTSETLLDSYRQTIYFIENLTFNFIITAFFF